MLEPANTGAWGAWSAGSLDEEILVVDDCEQVYSVRCMCVMGMSGAHTYARGSYLHIRAWLDNMSGKFLVCTTPYRKGRRVSTRTAS